MIVQHSKKGLQTQMPSPAVLTFALALLTVGSVLVVGLLTDVSTGDEVFHYRMAHIWYETGVRPVYDPLIEFFPPFFYPFDSDPLIPWLLKTGWTVTGGVSQIHLQVLLAASLAGIILTSFLFGKRLGGDKTGLACALFTATSPFFIVYSTVGYLDVPAIFLAFASLLLLAERQTLLSGLLLGLAILTKRNMVLFFPVHLLLIMEGEQRIKNMLIFCVGLVLTMLPEIAYRRTYWESVLVPRISLPDGTNINTQIGTQAGIPTSIPDSFAHTYGTLQLDPFALFKYFGFAVPVFFLVYLWQKKYHGIILFSLIAYISLAGYYIWPSIVIRYMAPALIPLSLGAGVALGGLRSKRLVLIVAAACLLQGGASLTAIGMRRTISPGAKDAYAWIREHTPTDARFLSPEYTLTDQTNRGMAWIRVPGLYPLLFNESEEIFDKVIENADLDYILIKKDRVYDPQIEGEHRLGYPQSFTNKLRRLASTRLVFENAEIELWETRCRLSADNGGRGRADVKP